MVELMLFKRFKTKTGNSLNNKKIEIEFKGVLSQETKEYIKEIYKVNVNSDIIYIDDTIDNRKSLKSLDDVTTLSNSFKVSSIIKQLDKKEIYLVKRILTDNNIYKGYIDIITDGKYSLKSKYQGSLLAIIDVNFGQLQLFKRNKLIKQVACDSIMPF